MQVTATLPKYCYSTSNRKLGWKRNWSIIPTALWAVEVWSQSQSHWSQIQSTSYLRHFV